MLVGLWRGYNFLDAYARGCHDLPAMGSLVQLRYVALAEGSSFLALLFIAMPLKYWAGFPLAVRIVGSAHGVLFVLFFFALARASVEHAWSLPRALYAFVASIIPFGSFVFDRSLKQEIAQKREKDATSQP